MTINAFEMHLEANGCHIHKRENHRGGVRLVFRRNDNHSIAQYSFAKDAISLSDSSICLVCHTLRIDSPKSLAEEDNFIGMIKKRNFDQEFGE